MRSIKHLPRAVCSSLRSSVIFFDLTRVVEELIFNSVDAGSTKVHVFVNVGACYIKVEDDGCGISRDGLVLLGERYATSKLRCLAEMDAGVESLGFRGEALGSLSDVSLLEVITKARGKPNGYRKVIKGCKCLFLGIDDYRQDVGTTVIVHDLFYNQPVRRKSIQNSPKKVVHSVKKCVLQTAFVCPQVSFKVIDIEGENELLHTHPSVSPLPLVASTFGNEISSSLHELKFSEGVFKISGYLSGPAVTFSTKVFQYIYVNLRSVCNGPIHKLLNSLTANLECSMSPWRDEPQSQNGKRHRTQAYPAYMLMLCCPQSCYDLTFEPSKTVVEFKEWPPVLSFIENAVRHFWSQFSSHFLKGESHGHEDDVRGEDKMWKERNNIAPLQGLITIDLCETSEMAKKRSKMQHYQSSAYISPSTGSLEMSSADTDFLSDQNQRSLSRELYTNATELKERRSKTASDETDHSFQNMISAAWNGSDPKCSQTARPKCNIFHSTPNIDIFPLEDHFLLEGSVLGQTVAEDNVIDDILQPRWRNGSLDVDANLGEGSTGIIAISDDSAYKYDAEKVSLISHGQGALKTAVFNNYPSIGGKPDDSALFSNHRGSGIQFDDFRIGRKRLAPVDTNDEFFVQTPVKEKQADFQLSSSIIRKCKMVTEFNALSCDLLKSNACGRVCKGSGFENGSLAQIGESVSDCQFPNSTWCLGSPYSVSGAAPWKDSDFADRYDTEENFMSCQSINFRDFKDGEEENFCGHDILQSSSIGDGRLTSTRTNSRIECENCFSPEKDMDKFLSYGHNFNEFFHKKIGSFCNIYDEICLDSSNTDTTDNNDKCSFPPSPNYNKMGKRPRKEEDVRNRGQYHVSMVRSRRSRSAPPFYKGRNKFSLLYNCLTIKAGQEPNLQSLRSAHHLPELKDSSESCGASLSYLKPILRENSIACSRAKGVQNSGGFEKFQNIQPCYTNTVEDIVSNDELQPSKVTLTKWRSGNPQPTDGGKLHNLRDQEDEILDISSGLLQLAGGLLVPESINKDCLESIKVLPQLDRKFIPAMAGGIFVIIDQHAADERIRVEELRRKVLSGEEKRIAYLDSEQELVLPETGFQLLQNYTEQIQDWGWICNIDVRGSGPFTKNMNLLHKRPFTVTLVAVPCILGINLSDKDLVEFLGQLAETDGTSTMPPAVLRILNFKACRGAIMFGDALLPSECSIIVEELKATSLCFQCAHGRPTTVPIVNMEALHKQLAKLRLQNGDSPEQWHGLRRHKPNLERAKLRLSQST